MPVFVKGKKPENQELRKRREERISRRTKYFVRRKDRDHADYKGIKLFIDGEEVEINDSAKFILEQLIADSKLSKKEE